MLGISYKLHTAIICRKQTMLTACASEVGSLPVQVSQGIT